MQPSHQNRLPVSKPDDGYRQRRNRQLLKPVDAGLPPENSQHHFSSSRDSGDVLAQPVGSAWTPGIIKIEVHTPEPRPFELGDLLTREFMARNNSFLISLGLHTLLLLILSFFLIHGTGKAMIMLELLSSPDIEEQPGVLAEFDVQLDESDKLVDAVSNDLFEDMFGSDANDGQPLSSRGTVAGIDGQSRGGSRDGDGKSAKFFGMRATGNRFVYVLDRSGSMGSQTQGPNDQFQRFDVARNELMNSVESLRPHQEFYVVLFSNRIRRMFDAESVLARPIKATPENKSRLRYWLSTIEAEGGTDARKSLQLAFKMDPDAIFMLSDGEFRDENNDALPKSIDIAKRFFQEQRPIQINSIAFEDQRSKINMQQLADASGGQFRFVRVNEFLEEMLNSPDQQLRIRALQHVASKGIHGWEQRYEFAINELIPLLTSKVATTRKAAQDMLHELSLGIFEPRVASVAGPDALFEARESAAAAWRTIWEDANALKTGGANSADPECDLVFFVAMASGFEDDFVESMEAIEIVGLAPLNQIAFARRVLSYQENQGVTPRTRQLLLDVFTELNKESTARFGSEFFLKNATQATCQARLKKVLSNRRIFARRLYRKWDAVKQDEELRHEFAQKIVERYPETNYAEQMRADVNWSQN